MIEIQGRIQRAAESILVNEALSADLDDDAAKILLDWGLTRTQQIVGQTIEMDQFQAEEAIYLPMRALRKMLRNANKWAMDPGENYLEKIFEQASVVYGLGFVQPNDAQQSAFTNQIPSAPSERLIILQKFVEGDQAGSSLE